MNTKFIRNAITRYLLEILVFGSGFIFIIGIAYAFSTWAPGQPPLALPVAGNVKLLGCPACPANYHVDTATNTCVASKVCIRSGDGGGFWIVHPNGDIAASWPGIGYIVYCKPCYFSEKIYGGYKYSRGNPDPYRSDGGWSWFYICREPIN
ncbi:MAG: hypothetical protein PHO48_00925 [Candidatus Gracilibacteria bacterium]|nr:hypothetical protein [Candidatus Gracilibacteria bacterium]MDD5179489.1 hypothetical protein [Candidatus Gracilibacteria bacterium]